MQLSISLIFEIIGLFTATFFFIQKRNKLLLYFIPFLLLTVTVEIMGRWGAFQKGFGKLAMYNIFTTLEFIFYTFLFYIHFKKLALKRIALVFIPAFLLAVGLNLIFIQGLNKTFHSYTFLLGSFFIVVFCCCFFYESVLPDKIDQQLSKQPFFWICSGLLIFYLGSVIINTLFEYLRSNDLQLEGKRIYTIINRSLNVILYTSFCIAFYLCRDHRKTYSSQS
jgi:hypothetical protein